MQLGQRGCEAWLIAQLATIILIIFPPVELQGLLDVVGMLAFVSGVMMVVYAFLSLGRNLSVLPEPRRKHALVKTGIYRYARHPMYGGSLVAFLGLAAVTKSEIRLVLTAVIWYVFELKAACEEELLCARYPAEYEHYKARVRKFIPFIY